MKLFHIALALPALLFAACGGSDPADTSGAGDGGDAAEEEDDHDHDEEVSLGTVVIDGMDVALAQGHGGLVAGEESHLVVKLPYNDGGSSIVRAWIGSQDRTQSLVGKGDYAESHDDYDIHADAPDPLSPDALWWIEIEKPDGTKSVGSAKPIFE